MSKRHKNKRGTIDGRWVAHPDALIRTLRELSLTARRILDTLEIEHCRHSGKENGNLICTYSDLERAGVDRTRIRKALDELVSFGLVEITRLGRRSYADLRNPTLYRITYLRTFKNGQETPANA
jgi:hypothetical protein